MLKKIILTSIALIIVLFCLNAEARRGCCSHHGGVNYCDRSQGMLVCRDGSYSPTCGCAMDAKPSKQTAKKQNSQNTDKNS
jgi:hypothetical protein